MDFLDLEVPDHGSPRSRDRKLRIAMKTLQIKGSGLAERPSDPVKRIGNPSKNRKSVKQILKSVKRIPDVKRMAPDRREATKSV